MSAAEITSLVAALTSLVMAVAALVRAARGEADHATNVERLETHADMLADLDARMAKPRRNRRVATPKLPSEPPPSLPGSGVA